MKNLLIALMLFSGVVAISACNDDPDTPGPSGSVCDTLIPSFAADILPLMQRSCSDNNLGSCHQAGSPRGAYVDYQSIKSGADNGQIESQVIVARSMPPSNSNGPTSLNQNEINSLQCWLDNGAPNN